ncbi:Gfo/Idh/MocA family protein [Saccharothrix obliqua]|uniref:Gfo/Idh/MocA family protein n=1 Tax=Saccharothrix obliqua TaxID=2861747 RepID=UPI001C5E17E3|nr:Gfo/Idh/MocA family oxidoreductase [Saccharothrix obliqua]MBW4718980.1 Gfo/Idh/MocA family oxidoreductase [Saccharothrix obliqua]
MVNKLRWGVVATGGIADTVTGDLRLIPDIEVLAVSSRALEKAQAFAAKHEIPRAYGDYRELIADPDIDVVYIATSHPQHHAVARAALEGGKHVLVEKPATLSLADTQDLVDLARERGLFLLEGLWTRFNPLVVKLQQLIADGELGDVRSLHSHFGFALEGALGHRLWDRQQGGGALVDLGLYPVQYAHLFLGAPDTVVAHGSFRNGVDAEVNLLLGYADGRSAHLSTSLVSTLDNNVVIIGSAGRAELFAPLYNPPKLVVNGKEYLYDDQVGEGYGLQAQEVSARIRAGETESPSLTPAESLAIQRTISAAAEQIGLNYDDVPK